MAGETHYQRLGVSEDATQEEIARAHRTLVKEFHPDSRPESWRARFDGMMAEVNEAYQTLSDPASRRRYDDRLAYARNGGGDGGADAGAEEEDAEAAWDEWEEEVYYDEGPDEPQPGPEHEDRREHAGAAAPSGTAGTVQQAASWFDSPETIAHRLPPAANLVGSVAASCLVWSFGILFLMNVSSLLVLVWAVGIPVGGYFALKTLGVVSGRGRGLGIAMIGGPVLAFLSGIGPFVFLWPLLALGGVLWLVVWGWALISRRTSVR